MGLTNSKLRLMLKMSLVKKLRYDFIESCKKVMIEPGRFGKVVFFRQ